MKKLTSTVTMFEKRTLLDEDGNPIIGNDGKPKKVRVALVVRHNGWYTASCMYKNNNGQNS
jgi:hypothetical protein